MDAKQYLNQAYDLEQKIRCDQDALEMLTEQSMSVSAVSYGERLFQSDNSNAGFVRAMHKKDRLKERIVKEMYLLMDLKDEILSTIETVPNIRERTVLQYRHFQNRTWQEIADKMYASRSTVIRWYENGVANVKLPEKPIDIMAFFEK